MVPCLFLAHSAPGMITSPNGIEFLVTVNDRPNIANVVVVHRILFVVLVQEIQFLRLVIVESCSQLAVNEPKTTPVALSSASYRHKTEHTVSHSE